MQAITKLVTHGRSELAKVIVGQSELVDGTLTALLCGGHALIEGVPGLGKTLSVKVLARALNVTFQRVQCTSDLMPADLLGSNILNLQNGTFSLHRGPMFTDLLLVDEINRMPPRTQASLLESMEERQVTIDGVRHSLSPLFTVLATQNPVEFEGTYPLPEAQLDRFLLKIKIGYPSAQEELEILAKHNSQSLGPGEQAEIAPIEPEVLQQARAELRQLTVEQSLLGYIAEIARRTRSWPSVSLGASPRAGISLMLVAKALAALADRDYVIPDDVKAAVLPALRHRIVLRPEAELEGLDTDRVLTDVLAAVEVPK
ncbi:MAG TPA: MoxR family ATPase [Candidatus Dormibacteraeota bacterium]|jgi:MoxR-like ATPase|nr:MoxR family ATPase [Candidatus Dormibacteraeota bacterium]